MVPRLALTLLLAVQLGGATAPWAAAAPPTFASAAAAATRALLGLLAPGGGSWEICAPAVCGATDTDWGADSLTDALALRQRLTGAPALLAPLRALARDAPAYPPPCSGSGCRAWSDVPEWDAIALARAYEATGNRLFLRKAEADYAYVQGSPGFWQGACPSIPYQQPSGDGNKLKTLETDANALKAGLLLFHDSGARDYLAAARLRYAAIRAAFLDPRVPLYTTYVFDDDGRCRQLPHRFFASVNGDMIWGGVALWRDTGAAGYLTEARATAGAVAADLSDGRGVFADLQAENDVVEPLVEGMLALALDAHDAGARAWILVNAAAALGARTPRGLFDRFFDGPPPRTTVTAWQTNGGIALEIAAAALAPRGRAPAGSAWAAARLHGTSISRLPAELRFDGDGIALLGTLGAVCCESGHARLLIDGRVSFDETGIWQNKSSAGVAIPGTVLFAWRWRRPGPHTLRFEPGVANGKEGRSFLHLTGYLLLTGSRRRG